MFGHSFTRFGGCTSCRAHSVLNHPKRAGRRRPAGRTLRRHVRGAGARRRPLRPRVQGVRRTRKGLPGGLERPRGWALAVVLAAGATAFSLSFPPIRGAADALWAFAADAGTVVAAQPAPAEAEQLVPRRASGVTRAAPALVGLQRDAAEDRAQRDGFVLTVDEQFSETVPQGQVVAQTPAAGTPQREDEPISIVVSAGRELAAVPNVIGLNASVARDLIEDTGFQVVELSTFSADVVAGVVLRQEPLAGALAARRSVVALSISRGVETTTVPPLVGRSEADARRAIELAGLLVGEVTYQESGSVPDGIVEVQTPPAGADVEKGREVMLTVVRVGEVEVPSLLGLAPRAAERRLADLGLLIAAIKRTPTEGVEVETVSAQEPGAGARVGRGFGLRLVVAIPPTATPTPTVNPAEG